VKKIRLIIYLLLFFLLSCAHHKPVATPEEVNDYLNRIAERSMFDLLTG
jgi:PBP1b-binding outer membrane lipoprotein LpoB